MEIKYSRFELNANIFGKNEIVGLIDVNSNYIYNRIYSIDHTSYKWNQRVSTYLLKNSLKNKRLAKTLKDEFYITKEIMDQKMSELSSGDLLKVLLINVCLSPAKVIILDHIDAYLNTRDLNELLMTLKKHKDEINKTIIFATNKIDKIINTTTKYIIASENRIIYSGYDIEELQEKTEIMKFVDAANKKGAKLKYYKDPSDLLKAIYRSVEK